MRGPTPLSRLLEWMFRAQCAACATEAWGLCEACSGALVELGPACPRCCEPSGEVSTLCGRCTRSPLPLDHIAAPWRFGGSLATAIRRLKFSGHTHVARALAPLWAPLLVAAVAAGSTPEARAVVVPVPLHWRRRVARGFDQTWLLAVHACELGQLPPPLPVLRRTRHSPPQSTLSAAARRDNLRGAFTLADARAVVGRTVVLVDDVVTTGSTVAAAARPLLAAGATRVLAIALARS